MSFLQNSLPYILAGISVANKLYRLVASAIMGFSQGFGPVAGFCYGARAGSSLCPGSFPETERPSFLKRRRIISI